MSAKNGLTRSLRLLGCLMGAALLVSALLASSASAKPSVQTKATYLALGDSLSFGYSQQLYNEGIEKGFDNPQNFEAGYVNDIYSKAHGAKNGVALQNDGCPGETTTSLIGPAIAAKLNATKQFEESQANNESLPITGTESPANPVPNCAYQEAWHLLKTVGAGGPLHHNYVGESQLENAIQTIATMQEDKQPVTTITLNIGPNDQLHAVKAIEKEVEGKVKAFAEHQVQVKYVEPVVTKELEEKYILPFVNGELFAKYIGPAVGQKCFEKTGGEEPQMGECLANEGAKLAGEYEAEKVAFLTEQGNKLAAEYFLGHKAELEVKGHELGIEYFIAHAAELTKKGEEIGHEYAIAHAAELQLEAEDKIVESARGQGAYAGKGLFEQIESNLAGILYALRHGSKFGGVDYTGKIEFLSAYNPYGKLFKDATEAASFVAAHGGFTGPFVSVDTGGVIHPMFPPLVTELAKDVEKVVGSYGGCATNAAAYFNPGGKKEPTRLQTLTNMANGTITAGKYDGPDIHATPKGYAEIAKLMMKNCSIGSLAKKG